MIIFYNTRTAKVNHTMWGEKLPVWYEFSSDENFVILKGGLDPHTAAHCKLELNENREPIAISKPIFGDPKGESIRTGREIIEYERLELVKSVEATENLYELVTQASEAL